MATRKIFFVLLGSGERKSPFSQLHNQACIAWGIPAQFFDLSTAGENLPDLLDNLRRQGFSGAVLPANLQIEILPFLDKLSPLAQRVGAVDTLYWEGGELVGHNTLAAAFTFPLYRQKITGPALILGAGPLSRSVLSALLSLSAITEILLCADTRSLAENVLASVSPAEQDEHTPYQIRHLAKKTIIDPEQLANVQPALVINCQTCARTFDIPWQVYQEKGLAYDTQMGKTPFLLAAETGGWKVLDGLTMFLSSAKEQFILWTGMPLPEIAEEKIRLDLEVDGNW